MTRPEKTEYAEFYADYIRLVEESNVISSLEKQIAGVQNLFAGISAEKENFRYAQNKWTVKELLGHLIDGERVFSYRALRISRGDETPLAGFEENQYVANGNFSDSSFDDLLEEFTALRRANVLMFKNFSEAMWLRRGTASDQTVSVRALAFMMVGHVRHHTNILRERYLI